MLDLHGMLACSTCLLASSIPFTLQQGEARVADQDALLKPLSRHSRHSQASLSAQTGNERMRIPDSCPPYHDDCCEPESSIERWGRIVVAKPVHQLSDSHNRRPALFQKPVLQLA